MILPWTAFVIDFTLFCQTFIDGILSGCFCKLMRKVVPIERWSCWYIFRLWARQKAQSSTRAAKFVVCYDCPTKWLMNVSVLDWAYNIDMAAWQSLILVNGQTKCWVSLIALSSMGRVLAVMGYLLGHSLSSKPT